MAGQLVDQPGAAPSAKLQAVGASGIATAAVLYVAGRLGLTLPVEVAEAIVLLGGWAGGYLKRDRRLAPLIADAETVVGEVEVVLHGRHEAPEG